MIMLGASQSAWEKSVAYTTTAKQLGGPDNSCCQIPVICEVFLTEKGKTKGAALRTSAKGGEKGVRKLGANRPADSAREFIDENPDAIHGLKPGFGQEVELVVVLG